MPRAADAFSAFWAGWSPPHLSPSGLRPVPGEENSKPQGGDLGVTCAQLSLQGGASTGKGTAHGAGGKRNTQHPCPSRAQQGS